jgi:hypothetical protein
MLSIKNTKSLSKKELIKINELIKRFDNSLAEDDTKNDQDDIIDLSDTGECCSNIPFVSEDHDLYNVLYNDYVIYEMANTDMSGVLGISINNEDKTALINQFYVSNGNFALGKKLISMVKIISKNILFMIVEKTNSEFIQFLESLSFEICEDHEDEILMAQKQYKQ